MFRLGLRYLLLAGAVLVLNFCLPRLLPGDPLQPALDDGPSAPLTRNQREQLRAAYRLDLPLPAQFVGYLGDLARGDLGWSISRSASIDRLIGERVPWTLALVGVAVLVAGVGGALLGLVVAWRPGGWSNLAISLATGLAALPEFLVAMLLLVGLAVGVGWFPLNGGEGAFAESGWSFDSLLDRAWHLVLPRATLVLANLAGFVLLARGTALDTMQCAYVETGRAKGLSDWQVVWRHAAPNALLPVLTLFGLRLGQVLGGAIVVERVFSVPGLGLFTFQAIQARDYPVLQAVFLLSSLSVLLANCVLELTYRRLEPRRAP